MRSISRAFGKILGGLVLSSFSKEKQGSFFYRNNWRDIARGKVPEKYTRLLPYIPGQRILEVGAAEGVLALLLARDHQKVFALEKNIDRHREALALQEKWRARGEDVSRCEMVNADLRDRMDLLAEIDTLVAVRSIYYLREDLPAVFQEISKRVPNVVLCGNVSRVKDFSEGRNDPKHGLGKYDYYATEEGMKSLLADAGYRIEAVLSDGDPIVVGKRDILG